MANEGKAYKIFSLIFAVPGLAIGFVAGAAVTAYRAFIAGVKAGFEAFL
jgi:hypothetical protein